MQLAQFTDTQQQLLQQHRDNWFAIATSTQPADRDAAEKAASELAAIGGVKVQKIVWVNTPNEGALAYRESFDASLSASLRDSIWASLSASLRDSFWASLSASLSASLRDSLWASLRDSLSASLWASLSASLRASLSASLRASIWDSPWVAFYLFGIALGIEYDTEEKRKLVLTAELLRACFACWVGLGTVVLCERPAAVDVCDGKLVGLTWRTE